MQKILLAVYILITSSMAVYGQQPVIFQTRGKAINGYDVVAYYNAGQPVKGNDSLSF
ncbi:MAG: hypothetical protein J0L56_03665 [Chitinophagales bacterium]|nr:hypothetical protein [Chitinophagales bacterium]